MKTIIAKLLENNGRQRFYELSDPITKGARDLDLVKLIAEAYAASLAQYKSSIRTDGCHVVCVSDARTHIERLCFVAEKFDFGCTPIDMECIAGKHTFMIHGGDYDAVYPDAVYLRFLGKLNGVRIEIV